MRKRKQLTLTLPEELVEYLNSKIEDRTFANISHGVEFCVLRYKEAEEKKRIPGP